MTVEYLKNYLKIPEITKSDPPANSTVADNVCF